MRTMKKIVTGMSVAAIALAVAGGVNAANAGAEGAASINETSAQMQQMKVSGETAEIMVSYDAIKVSKNGIAWNAKAKWDVYDGTSATVDLSSLKTAKDVYIAVKDNSSATPKVYKLDADADKLAGKYEVADGKSTLTFTNNKTAITDATLYADDVAMLEYRTENSNAWTAYNPKKFPMAMYEQQGATLYFRRAAVAYAFKEKEDDSVTDYVLQEKSKGCFASKEFKVKVGKMANAPTASVNYDTATFTIKKGTEYRWLNKSGAFKAPTGGEAGDWTAAGADKTTSVAIADITASGTFEVRTAAAAKKVASKISVYSYKGVATPVKTSATSVDDGKLTLEYGKSTGKAPKNQITFKSTNADASYLVYTEDPAANAKAKPVATIKKYSEDAKKYKDVTVVESAKLKDGDKLYIVTASDKATGVFRSKALGAVAEGETFNGITVAFPAAAPEPTATPAAE